MTKFKKGQGGRPTGAKNKTTEQVREAFNQLLTENLPQLKNDIAELEPKDRVKVLLDLAKFVVPTLKSQDLGIDEKNQITTITRTIVKPERMEVIFKDFSE
jgi:hypothetical protein